MWVSDTVTQDLPRLSRLLVKRQRYHLITFLLPATLSLIGGHQIKSGTKFETLFFIVIALHCVCCFQRVHSSAKPQTHSANRPPSSSAWSLGPATSTGMREDAWLLKLLLISLNADCARKVSRLVWSFMKKIHHTVSCHNHSTFKFLTTETVNILIFTRYKVTLIDRKRSMNSEQKYFTVSCKNRLDYILKDIPLILL